ncbi:MAG: C25 family cysteine peptidase [Candidatus Latescibacterota bacterium]
MAYGGLPGQPLIPLLLLLAATPGRPEQILRVLAADAGQVTVELRLAAPELPAAGDGARTPLRLHLPGFAHPAEPGQPDLPFLARLVAAPPGSRVHVEVLAAEWSERTGVRVAPVADPAAETEVPGSGPDPDIPASGAHPAPPRSRHSEPGQPVPEAECEPLGILRGVPAHALRLHPFQYDPARRVLRVCTRMRVRLRFAGSAASRPSTRTAAPHPQLRAFLNPEQAASFAVPRRAAAKPAAADWYDPAVPWVKVYVEADGIYRIDTAWLRRYVDPEEVDPRTLRLFCLGEEQVVHVAGQEDGHLDGGDYLLFHGRHRRAPDRDFASLYGARNVYWLTWGGPAGRRFAERSGAPAAGLPEVTSFWTTVHLEKDSHDSYDPLENAPAGEQDHWFWDSVDTDRSGNAGAATFAGSVPHALQDGSHRPRVRVALHGRTDLGHHTQMRMVGGPVLADTVWGGAGAGQVPLVVEKEVADSALRDSLVRIVVRTLADQAKWDQVYMNWFEADYRRLFVADGGYLAFAPPAAPHRITVSGLASTRVELLDVGRGLRLVGMQVDSTQDGVRLTFEDPGEQAGQYVLADSSAWHIPMGALDTLSSWRETGHAADLLILTPGALRQPAHRLAEHRRLAGRRVEVVLTEDLYDEFSYGLLDGGAIADFVRHAYQAWSAPPAAVLLLGDDTYDYRNLSAERTGRSLPQLVPSPRFQARGRGEATSDYLLTLVDGEDLLADLAVGRLPASSVEEAESAVDKVVGYDRDPEPGDWRTRIIYAADYDAANTFANASDSLASRYTEPLGLRSVKIYVPQPYTVLPFPSYLSRTFTEELNRGALLLNYSGHGNAVSLNQLAMIGHPDWGWLGQVRNAGRLPLVVALSCLNGQFTNPLVEGLAEVLTTLPDGGAVAYLSATSKSFVAQNELLSELLYERFFVAGELALGPALDAAKAGLLAAHPSWEDAALAMQLFGDPLQDLALPTGPDYEARGLATTASPVFGQTRVGLSALVANLGRPTTDRVEVLVVGRPAAPAGEPAAPETLLAAVLPSLGGADTLAFDWAVGRRRGPWELEVLVDPAGRVEELDEANNRAALRVEVLEPLEAIPIFPPDGAVLRPQDLSLEAAVPQGGGPYTCEFALSPDPAFPPVVTAEAPAEPVDGLAVFRTDAMDPDLPGVWRPFFWRARLRQGGHTGAWSRTRTFRLDPEPGTHAWQQEGIQLDVAPAGPLVRQGEDLTVSAEPLPFHPDSSTREDGFTVRGLAGAGVLVTDGHFLFAKRWYHDATTVYPGTDFFTRIGTGLAGTHRAGPYGLLPDSTTAGISAACHGDGYIYSEMGRAFQLERLSATTGRRDTVSVPAGLVNWQTGRIQDGHVLVTSDGRYVYNVSMSSERGAHVEWRVRVFDPANDWALVREFTSPPTENGFTYPLTDGVLADGRRLYLLEHRTPLQPGPARIRMIDAVDGRFLDEWVGPQTALRLVSGQYDWVNNKVWMGDLWQGAVYRFTGLGYADSASYLSPPIGPAWRWRELRVEGGTEEGGTLAVDVLVEEDGEWTVHPGLSGLPAGQSVDLGAVSAERYPQIRLRARLGGGPGRARLHGVSADFEARHSLGLVSALGRLHNGRLQVTAQVRNLAPVPALGARLQVLAAGRTLPWAERSLPPLGRGQTLRLTLDSLEVPPARTRLFAALAQTRVDADPADERREVLLLFGGRAPLTLQTWPGGQAFHSGDPLPPGSGLVIAAPGVPEAELRLRVDGEASLPDSLFDTWPEGSPRVLYRPRLSEGEHTLDVRLVRDGEELGSRQVAFRLGEGLAVGNPLVYPHPVRQRAAFTYVLSAQARVEVDIFSLGGRLVRRLGPLAQGPGFQQIEWDGRDAEGRWLAGGTYLYRLRARGERGEASVRRPLVVVR